MGGFRIRDVEVNGDFAFADRMEMSVIRHTSVHLPINIKLVELLI